VTSRVERKNKSKRENEKEKEREREREREIQRETEREIERERDLPKIRCLLATDAVPTDIQFSECLRFSW